MYKENDIGWLAGYVDSNATSVRKDGTFAVRAHDEHTARHVARLLSVALKRTVEPEFIIGNRRWTWVCRVPATEVPSLMQFLDGFSIRRRSENRVNAAKRVCE